MRRRGAGRRGTVGLAATVLGLAALLTACGGAVALEGAAPGVEPTPDAVATAYAQFQATATADRLTAGPPAPRAPSPATPTPAPRAGARTADLELGFQDVVMRSANIVVCDQALHLVREVAALEVGQEIATRAMVDMADEIDMAAMLAMPDVSAPAVQLVDLLEVGDLEGFGLTAHALQAACENIGFSSP